MNPNQVNRSFSGRAATLLRKVDQIHEVCGANVALICYRANGLQSALRGHPDIQQVFNFYQMREGVELAQPHLNDADAYAMNLAQEANIPNAAENLSNLKIQEFRELIDQTNSALLTLPALGAIEQILAPFLHEIRARLAG